MNNKSENLAARVSLRPVVMPDDEDFLIRVYSGTRHDVAMLEIPQAQKDEFTLMQFQAQKRHYASHFPEAAHDIILLDAQPAGRFMVGREPDEIICIDISLLPEFRNQGIGTLLLRDLIDEAARTNRIFRLHVVQNNRAVRLYKRLGFSITGETGFHFKMELQPARAKEQ
ncbi:MAG TPA: GNAT family N-acetyltransferase [Pyrinomonadaceae bacterium]|jgi:ribosomal protein S18 acetylase RimI-like enzyme